MNKFEEHFAELPLIAILRGISPDELDDVALTLLDSGFRLIEIPLNSPNPFASIERLSSILGDKATFGAGTVLTPSEVDQVVATRGKLVVSPNCDPTVIKRSIEMDMIAISGIRTATEAFAAIDAGVKILKFFPCSLLTANEITALKSVLPRDISILAVGGVDASNAKQFRQAGADGLGIGSALYKPGKSLDQLQADAIAIISAWQTY